MKKLFFAIIALFSVVAAQAQIEFAEYQPLVQEGREWVNYYYAEGNKVTKFHYSYYFKGDTVIDGFSYKKCYMKISDKDRKLAENAEQLSSLSQIPIETSLPVAFLRDNDGDVIGIYDERYIPDHQEVYPDANGVSLIYDFSKCRHDAISQKNHFETIDIEGVTCNMFEYYGAESFVESIGSVKGGTLLYPKWVSVPSTSYSVSGLSHVINEKGEIIYKSPEYHGFMDTEFIFGDVNLDGIVDVSDLNLVINKMLGEKVSDTWYRLDVNEDNKIDISDVNAVINAILGLE